MGHYMSDSMKAILGCLFCVAMLFLAIYIKTIPPMRNKPMSDEELQRLGFTRKNNNKK